MIDAGVDYAWIRWIGRKINENLFDWFECLKIIRLKRRDCHIQNKLTVFIKIFIKIIINKIIQLRIFYVKMMINNVSLLENAHAWLYYIVSY